MFLKQISKISKGNVRLAFMAGISAKQEGYYANIQNSTEIFSSYFKYIFKDLNGSELIVMAITAFIESFEIQNNESLVYKLANVAEITNDFVIETCKKFHNLEVVDVYENLAVKFSDQNLCDYVIYYIFFESKDIKLEKLISLVFPYAPEKVTYHLSTTLQLFYSDDMLDYLKTSVKHVWSEIILNKDLAYKYAECFHNLIEDEVLLFIKAEISNIQINKIDILHYQFSKNNSSQNDNILKILTGYKYSSNLDSSVELFVQYVNKNSSNPERIKVYLINGYNKTSLIINSYNIEKIANWYRELISFIPEDKIDLAFCTQVLNGLSENNILYRLSFETVSRINWKQPFFMQEYINEIINIYDSKKESHQLVSEFLNHGNIFDENNINDFLKSFKSNNQLIKIYVYASKEEINFDYQNILFNAILKNDKSIINAIIDLYLDGDSNHENLNHLKTIWDYDNYLYLFEYTVNYIAEHNTNDFIIMNCLKDVMETLYSHQEKLMESILYLIDKNKSNDKLVKYIIQASDVLSKEHRYKLTLYVCKINTSIDIFKLCPIGQYPKQGWSGSTVPVLENRIKEYEEMISKLEGVDYIEHRIYCKKCIDYIREEIKSTISKEFVYDY